MQKFFVELTMLHVSVVNCLKTYTIISLVHKAFHVGAELDYWVYNVDVITQHYFPSQIFTMKSLLLQSANVHFISLTELGFVTLSNRHFKLEKPFRTKSKTSKGLERCLYGVLWAGALPT